MFGNTADHITSPRNGGAFFDMANLRWLCREHDNQMKEDTMGKRRSGGKATVRGCDANGWPIDPSHPWNTTQQR